jgi:uncharacterized protein (TIGR03083 family)
MREVAAMTLPREETVEGLLAELRTFEELVRSIETESWGLPTRCEAWNVADVAAHVVGGMTRVVAGQFDGLGTPETTQAIVDERRGRTPAELAGELAEARKLAADIADGFDDEAWEGPNPAGLPGTLGAGVEGLWYDTYVHAEDIRSAVDRPSVRGPGLRASVAHLADLLTTNGWGPATLSLEAMDEFPILGGGRPIHGDALQFILVATGRADPGSMGLDKAVSVYA